MCFRSPFPYIQFSVSVHLCPLNRFAQAQFSLKSGKQDRDNERCGMTEEVIEMKVILYMNVSYQRLLSYQQNMAPNNQD